MLIITPDLQYPNRLNLQIVVKPLTPDHDYERFFGHFYSYGQTLLGVPVLKTEDPHLALVRRLEFPVGDATRTREDMVKIGIVSGNSAQLRAPVSAKCLVSKISNAHLAQPAYLSIVKRYSKTDLYPPYVDAISNDTREQQDFVLCVHPARKPAARPRNSAPPLPADPDDPDHHT